MINVILKRCATCFKLIILIVSMYVVLGGTGSVVIADTDDLESTTRTVFSQIKWKELPGGRSLAHVKGDFTQGEHIKFIKFAAGNKTALHIHSHSYVGIVVKGTARHYEPSKPETETILPAGSFWHIPANVPHISECLPGADCIFATQSNGAFDIKSVK